MRFVFMIILILIHQFFFFTPATASSTRGHNYKLLNHTPAVWPDLSSLAIVLLKIGIIHPTTLLMQILSILLNIYLMIIGQNIFMNYYNCTCCCMYACIGYTGCAFFP